MADAMQELRRKTNPLFGDRKLKLGTFGQNLDPAAPLSASVKPFTPTLLGEGGLGQFKTYATAGWGLWLAVACSVLSIVAFVFHRRAYKPLFERANSQPKTETLACAR